MIFREEIAEFFEPAVTATVKAIKEHIRDCPLEVSAVYLVGGFSTSVYLTTEVQHRLRSYNIKVATPDGQTYVQSQLACKY